MLWLILLISTCTSSVLSTEEVTGGCTVTKYSDVASAVKSCTNIVIENLSVPANKRLELDLKDGTTLTFKGTTKFEVGNLNGWLMTISGKKITVIGEKGSVIHGNGEHYWDGQGGAGRIKPRLLFINGVTDAVFKNIYLKNCPLFCTSIHKATNLKIDGWTADCADGDNLAHKGRNTDGIGISAWSTNVEINNAYIHNQDQCLYVNEGTNMRFTNIHCVNSNGICATGGFSETSALENTTKNITFHNCVMEGGLTGVQIIAMAKPGGPGEISDIKFQNVQLKGIHEQGIFIETDYGNAGHPNNKLDVKNIEFSHITGTVDSQARAVKIVCSKKCSNIVMSNIDIKGSKVANQCNFKPTGFTC